MNLGKLARLVFVLTGLLLPISNATGQSRESVRTVVDTLLLKNQKAIRGLVLGEDAIEGIVVAVSKKWLEKEMPERYAKAMQAAQMGAKNARLSLRDRLKNIVDHPEEPKVAAFELLIRNELDRIEKEIENPSDTDAQFLILRIKPSAIAGKNLVDDRNKRVAIWSWHERLTDVETRSPSSLVKELQGKNIDGTLPPPSLANRFYPIEENDDQWNARIAMVAHRMAQPIEFQGTGEVMIAVNNQRPPNVASMLGPLLQSQANALLQELVDGPLKTFQNQQDSLPWAKNAIVQASQRNARYLRATHLKMDPLQATANVESLFIVKQSDGNWRVVWRASATQCAKDQQDESVQRIREDPQVVAIQSQLESLGGASQAWELALRMGAATRTAQNEVSNAFLRFSESYLNRLDSPPILLTGPSIQK